MKRVNGLTVRRASPSGASDTRHELGTIIAHALRALQMPCISWAMEIGLCRSAFKKSPCGENDSNRVAAGWDNHAEYQVPGAFYARDGTADIW